MAQELPVKIIAFASNWDSLFIAAFLLDKHVYILLFLAQLGKNNSEEHA